MEKINIDQRKIELTTRQVLEYIIIGIKNGRYQAAINLAQDFIDSMDASSRLTKDKH